jgi:hypothetical protein
MGFTIPEGATINGIEVDVKKSYSTSGGVVSDGAASGVRLIVDPSISTAIVAASPATWPTSNTWVTYGGPTALWGATWAADNFNSVTFGVDLSAAQTNGAAATAYVDNIKVTVYYTAPAIIGGGDCNDNSGAVYPNEPFYYNAPTNGSFDYDCSGVVTQVLTNMSASTTCTYYPSPDNICVDSSNGAAGWSGSAPPACGTQGTWNDFNSGVACPQIKPSCPVEARTTAMYQFCK